MAALTVWKFPSPAGTDAALAKLEDVQGRALIRGHDAAVVSRDESRGKAAELIQTNLSQEQDARLRAAFTNGA